MVLSTIERHYPPLYCNTAGVTRLLRRLEALETPCSRHRYRRVLTGVRESGFGTRRIIGSRIHRAYPARPFSYRAMHLTIHRVWRLSVRPTVSQRLLHNGSTVMKRGTYKGYAVRGHAIRSAKRLSATRALCGERDDYTRQQAGPSFRNLGACSIVSRKRKMLGCPGGA